MTPKCNQRHNPLGNNKQNDMGRLSVSLERSLLSGMAAHGRPAGLNSSKSPLSVRVLWTVPAGSSMTECADRHAERRQGGTLLLTFRMRCLRSRYTRSIGNCMPKVCTDSQGTIHIPSPEIG